LTSDASSVKPSSNSPNTKFKKSWLVPRTELLISVLKNVPVLIKTPDKQSIAIPAERQSPEAAQTLRKVRAVTFFAPAHVQPNGTILTGQLEPGSPS
jgi:hypothetical protein